MKHCTSKRSTIVLALIKKLRFLMSANMYSLATASNARLLSSDRVLWCRYVSGSDVWLGGGMEV
jgi:hypothetical protein